MPRLKYRYDWNIIAAKARSQHQLDTRMGSVEEAVSKMAAEGKMQDPYKKYRELRGKGQETTELHASRGKKLQEEENRNVLEFDVGGSGFWSPQARHVNLGGKRNIVEGKTKVSLKDIRDGKKWNVHFWNRIKWMQKLPSFMRPRAQEEIVRHNDIIDRYGTNILGGKRKEGQQTRADYKFQQKYGVNSKLDSLKDKKDIYVKEGEPTLLSKGRSVRSVRYSMPGPQGLGGASNRGTYSIQNLSQYMLDAGKAYLEPFFEKWTQIESEAGQAFTYPGERNMKQNAEYVKEIREKILPVTIMLRGHSRGGVAVSHGAMRIKNWIHENYPQFEKYVNFEMIQMDPVAGYGSDHGLKRNINLMEEKRPELKQEMKERGMRELGSAAETTVVYSLHTEHSHFFSPQVVEGAKRVILTTGKHSVNLESIDSSQEEYGIRKSHREGYMDASTGEMYRNSGLSELPEGFYIADEKNRLIRIPDARTGKELLGEILKDVSGQKGRHNRINEVMEKWFQAYDKKMEQERQHLRERVDVKTLQKKEEKEVYAAPRISKEPEPGRENRKREKTIQ